MTQESIETTVARLDERVGGIQSLFAQIVDDQRRMAASYEKLVEGNQRVALVEAEVVSVKEGQKQLWIKMDGFALKIDSLSAESVKTSQKWLWEIAKTALTVVGAVLAYKLFGVHA